MLEDKIERVEGATEGHDDVMDQADALDQAIDMMADDSFDVMALDDETDVPSYSYNYRVSSGKTKKNKDGDGYEIFYELSDRGIKKVGVFDDGADFEIDTVCNRAFMPIELINATGFTDGSDAIFLRAQYRTHAKVDKEVTVPLASLINPRGSKDFAELAKAGFTLTEKQYGLFGETISEIIDAMVDVGDLYVSVGRGVCGWHDGEHFTPGKPGYAGNFPTVARKKGDPELWRKAMHDVAMHSPLMSILTAASFGGYLRGVIPDVSHNNIFYLLSHNGGRGKSTAQSYMSSIQGEPKKGGNSPYAASESTTVGAERYMAACNNSAFHVDEVNGLINAGEKAAGIVMAMTNCGGRAKAGEKGGLNRGEMFHLQITWSGNMSLLELLNRSAIKNKQEKTLLTRIIEVDLTANPLFIGTAEEITKFSRDTTQTFEANHGHGYEPAIEYIKTNRQVLIDLHYEYVSSLNPRLIEEYNDGSRKAKDLAFFRCGIEVMAHVLDLSDAERQKAIDDLDVFAENFCVAVEDRQTPAEETADKKNELISFVASHISHFKIVGKLHHSYVRDGGDSRDNQELIAEKHNAEVRDGVWGRIEQTDEMENDLDFTGKIYISKVAKAAAERDSVSLETVIDVAKRDGWLIVSSAKSERHRNDIKTRFCGRCNAFDLSKLVTVKPAVVEAETAVKDPVVKEMVDRINALSLGGELVTDTIDF